MTGRTIIITGANSGIGLEAARYLCEGGNDVIVACRDETKGKVAIQKIKTQNPNALVTFLKLDLSSTESIKQFVNNFLSLKKKLHVLVNNAAILFGTSDKKFHATEDKFEQTMATNYLGPFLLTNLLLDSLKETAGLKGSASIVNVTDRNHDPQNLKKKDIVNLDTENFFLTKLDTYNSVQAYKNSKLCDVMFTCQLSRRLEGTGVTVNSVSPGVMPTTGLNRADNSAHKFFMKWVVHRALRFTETTQTISRGAQAVVNLVENEELKGVTGKYFYRLEESTSSTESQDEELQRKLWDLTAGYLRLEGYEAIDVPEPEVPPPPPPKEEVKVEDSKMEGVKDEDVKVEENAKEKADEATEDQKVSQTVSEASTVVVSEKVEKETVAPPDEKKEQL